MSQSKPTELERVSLSTMVRNITQSSNPKFLVDTRTYALKITIINAVIHVFQYMASIAGPLSC